jgi:pantetheine-phosphate adenylyltransferase
MLKEAVADVENAEVDSFSGLLVDYASARDITIIVKGLRAVTDFDFELQMAQMNHRMTGVETFFVPTSPQWSYLSSSLIKEVMRFGGDISGLVPEFVRDRLEEKLVPGKE